MTRRGGRNTLITLGLVLATAAIGWLDHVTGPAFSLEVLYLVTIAAAAWWLSRPAALALALAAAVAWGLGHLWHVAPGELAARYWSGLSQVVVFGIVGMIVSRLRAHTDGERAHLAAVLEQSYDSVILTDIEGTIQYVNPAFEHLTGYSRQEAAGRNPRLLKGGVHDASFYRSMWDALTRGGRWSGRFVNRKKDGTLYHADGTVAAVRNARGEAVGYVGISRDVTAELALQASLLQAQKLEAIGQLAAGVAHDFSNLIGVIQAESEHAEAVSGTGVDLPITSLSRIRSAADRAALLTRQMMAFSRRQLLETTRFSLEDVVNDLDPAIVRMAGTEIELSVRFDRDSGRTIADRAQVRQLLLSLVANAVEAMPSGGRLVIETGTAHLEQEYVKSLGDVLPGDYVVLAVSDTGAGMTDYVKSFLFEPFFTSKDEHVGLGLATSYGIVRQFGGHIDVHSEPGVGTTMRAYLPRADPPAGVERLAPSEGGARNDGVILLVEQDEDLRARLERTLAADRYKVFSAEDSTAAVRMLDGYEGCLDLLLTEVVVPTAGGRAVADWTRKVRPETAVIFMSGYSEDLLFEKRLLDPGMLFLQQPFTSDALLRLVRETIRETPPRQR